MNRFASTILAILAVMAPASATAVVQGALGVTSTAEIDISVSIRPTLQINRVSDIQIDIYDTTRDASFTQRFCVRGTPGEKYTIIATGLHSAEGGFALTNESGELLKFHLTYAADLARGLGDELTPSIASPPYDLLSNRTDCGGADNTAMTLTIFADDMKDVSAGLYSGFVTLYVAPQ